MKATAFNLSYIQLPMLIMKWVTSHSCNKILIHCNINNGPSYFIVMRFHYDLFETIYTIYRKK